MGFFDSKTKQTVNQNTQTETNTTQLDLSGNQGVNLAQVNGGVALDLSTRESYTDNSIVNMLDAGALKIAGNIAKESLSVAAGGLQNALAANAGALQFGSQAIDQLAESNRNSLDVFGGLVTDAFGFARDTSRDVADIASDALMQFSDFSRQSTADAIAGFGALAKQGSESTDDKVTKVAMYGLLALAAVLVVPQLFKGARA